MLLDCVGKLEYLEKSHTSIRRTCKLQRPKLGFKQATIWFWCNIANHRVTRLPSKHTVVWKSILSLFLLVCCHQTNFNVRQRSLRYMCKKLSKPTRTYMKKYESSTVKTTADQKKHKDPSLPNFAQKNKQTKNNILVIRNTFGKVFCGQDKSENVWEVVHLVKLSQHFRKRKSYWKLMKPWILFSTLTRRNSYGECPAIILWLN